MMKILVYYFVYCLSRSPILSITMDKYFHEITDEDCVNFEDFRYSLLSFGLGTVKFYFVTYEKNDGFKFLKTLRLSNVKSLPSENEIEQKVESYSELLETKESKDIEVEIDFLKYKIANEESVKNLASSKINNYTTMILVLIPLIFVSGLKFGLEVKSKALIITTIAILYCMLNVILFILDFYKVKGFRRSTFGNLKISNNHFKKLAESYYEDWYSIKSESPLFVTYVRNVERYIKITMIFIIIFIVFNSINVGKQFSLTSLPTILHKGNYSYDITLKTEIALSDLNKLNEIQKKLLESQVKQIIVIKIASNDERVSDSYNRIMDSLKMNNIGHADIVEVLQDQGNQKEYNYCKIIMIGVGK